MKVKVAEASDVVLDYMVAVALGGTEPWFDTVDTCWIKLDDEDRALSTKCSDQQNFAPTTLWAHGGPIIEREITGVDLVSEWKGVKKWSARKFEYLPNDQTRCTEQYGPTILIAAMRCLVTSRLGPEVEVPDELLET